MRRALRHMHQCVCSTCNRYVVSDTKYGHVMSRVRYTHALSVRDVSFPYRMTLSIAGLGDAEGQLVRELLKSLLACSAREDPAERSTDVYTLRDRYLLRCLVAPIVL